MADVSEINMNSEGSDVESSYSDDSVPNESDIEKSGNSAWADAMCRVLNTNVSKKKNFILSKAKKDTETKEKKKEEIEIVDESGIVLKDDKPGAIPNLKSFKEKRIELLEKQKQKSAWESMCRVKPDITQKDRERELMRIATRGVVHLFNTVEKHQKSVQDPKERSARKKDNPGAVKGTFMDILKGHSKRGQASEAADNVAKKVKEEETWSILKDDFMMGAELKDWDKESDND